LAHPDGSTTHDGRIETSASPPSPKLSSEDLALVNSFFDALVTKAKLRLITGGAS